MERLFHIATAEDWAEAIETGAYEISTRGRRLSDVGFIHASFLHQVETVGSAIYGDCSDELLVLEIDPDRVDVEIRVEPAVEGGESFPHLYGPLATRAVIATHEATVDAGRFRFGQPNRLP